MKFKFKNWQELKEYCLFGKQCEYCQFYVACGKVAGGDTLYSDKSFQKRFKELLSYHRKKILEKLLR